MLIFVKGYYWQDFFDSLKGWYLNQTYMDKLYLFVSELPYKSVFTIPLVYLTGGLAGYHSSGSGISKSSGIRKVSMMRFVSSFISK